MKVMICASGSGGHIYPALRLAEELRNGRFAADIVFLSTRRSIEKKIFEKTSFRVISTDVISPYSGDGGNYLKFLLKYLNFLLKFIIESIKAAMLMRRERPDVVVGFGGIGSITAVIAATLMLIPTVIHEQNLVPGRANRLLARFATKISLGFIQSAKNFSRKDTEYTGNPLRGGLTRIDRAQARCALNLDSEKFTIFVFGGSQGSEFLNTAFLQGMQHIPDYLINKIQVIHSTGSNDNRDICAGYRRYAVPNKVFSYCTDMSTAYSAADIVISRAGAGTLSEINYFGRPAVLIPYPYAQAHQVRNAQCLQEQGAACLVFQDKDSARQIGYAVARLIQDRTALEAMAQKSRSLSDDAAVSKLAALIGAVAQKGSKVR